MTFHPRWPKGLEWVGFTIAFPFMIAWVIIDFLVASAYAFGAYCEDVFT